MARAESEDGAGRIFVQSLGTGEKRVIDAPWMALTRYGHRRVAETDADRIAPYSRSIRLIGRREIFDDFLGWLHGDAPISIRVLTGSGGRGKTRFALDLCDEVAGGGWRSGFVDRDELARFMTQPDLLDWGWNAPTLIVFDYAGERTEELARFVRHLHTLSVDRKGERLPPLRILALERQADTRAGWWVDVFGREGSGPRRDIDDIMDRSEPIRLEAIESPQDRRDILDAMFQAMDSDLRVPSPEEDPGFDQSLAYQSWGGEPLFLMMAASVAARAGMNMLLALDRDQLAFRVAGRELERIVTVMGQEGVRDDFARHLGAYATLCQGMTRTLARQVIEAEFKHMAETDTGGAGHLADLLHQVLPASDNDIAPILPDVVGEAAMIEVWTSPGGARGQDVVVRAAEHSFDQVVATVIRTVQDFSILGHTAPLTWLNALGKAAEDEIDPSALQALVAALPEETLIMRQMAARFARQLVDRRREAVERAHSVASQDQLADSLRRLSKRLSDLGHWEAALEAGEEAVAIYRALDQDHPQRFLADLATALITLTRPLAELGLREKAHDACQNAVAIRRDLDKAHPDRSLPDLARSLSHLSSRLADLGRWEEAVDRIEEAVGLWRDLVQDKPDEFRPELAAALNSRSDRLVDLWQFDEALQSVEEALTIRRGLAHENPDAYRPDYAESLDSYANRLRQMDRHQPALEAAEEAVRIYRELAQGRGDVFRPQLARAYITLSNCLSAVRKNVLALELIEEAVRICRRLTARHPDAFRAHLARAYNNLATCLASQGRHEEALDAAELATDYRRALNDQHPEAFRPELARSLTNLANRLRRLRRLPEALASIEEAVAIWKTLASARSFFEPELAMALDTQASILPDLDRATEAHDGAMEAIRLLWPHLEAAPSIFQSRMRRVADTYRDVCNALGVKPDPDVLKPIDDFLKMLEQ